MVLHFTFSMQRNLVEVIIIKALSLVVLSTAYSPVQLSSFNRQLVQIILGIKLRKASTRLSFSSSYFISISHIRYSFRKVLALLFLFVGEINRAVKNRERDRLKRSSVSHRKDNKIDGKQLVKFHFHVLHFSYTQFYIICSGKCSLMSREGLRQKILKIVSALIEGILLRQLKLC